MNRKIESIYAAFVGIYICMITHGRGDASFEQLCLKSITEKDILEWNEINNWWR